MKIQFLLLRADNLAGTERAAVSQANALAGRHEVEIISTLRSSHTGRSDVDPRVRLRYLADEIGHGDVEHKVRHAKQLAGLPSTLVPNHWDPTLNALCDVALERFLPSTDADVVVTLTTGLLTAAAQRLPARTALVHQEHRSSMHRTAGMEPLLTFGPRTDALVSLTEVNAQWLRETLGAQAPPVYVVPNAAPGPEMPQSDLERPLIMAAGRLDGEKQHLHLVRAFGMIAEEIPEWRVRIFGTGRNRVGLLRAARRLKLYDRLELPGATKDLAAEWAKASISALTSTREGLPLVIQESFAAGVPVVSYDCPTGPGELIQHGVNGYLVPQDDEEALAAHLLDLASDTAKRKQFGAAARRSLARYDQAEITAQWESIYADAAAARTAQAEPWLQRQLGAKPPRATHSGVAAPAITPGESRRDLVAVTARALQALSGWFMLPARGEHPPTFVVPAEHREEALKAVAAGDLPAHVCAVVEEMDHWQPRRGSVAEVAGLLESTMAKGLTLEPWPVVRGTASHLKWESGIRVEFWSRGRDGALVAPRRGLFALRVAEDDLGPVQVEGVDVPGLAGLQPPYADECRFPVDVVYTWVDDSDPVWREARDRATAEAGAEQSRREAAGDARFRNRDELRYSLRSIHAHAPWVRNIFLVTAGQRPEWLADHPDVTVVDHREILPADALPTFNSHAIETGLHRIPGLGEHFLYFNDDMFLGRPFAPERFFSPGGSFAVHFSTFPVGLEGRDDRPYVRAAFNNRALIREKFGLTLTQHLTHAPYPLRRSVMEEVAAEFAGAIDRTARSRFRSPEDVSPTSSLVQYYGMATGAAHRGDIGTAFIDASRADVQGRLKQLVQKREVDTFCIGDHHDYAIPEGEVSKHLAEFFEDYFPVKPPWEK